ncbi:lectin-like domain-containing protein, partial [Apilactobacillus kunkeei]|uniref:lectin-like domain-containing protein n=1 Tax=Apilactobacillus kunkeei TaxID=148814 RepID=UPI000B0B22F2
MMNKENKQKKILHKIKKNWVVIGMASVSLLGAGYVTVQGTNIVSPSVVAHADTLNNQGPVTINIDKNNFLDNFQLLKDASYNQNNGVITLTTDNESQSGGVSLKNKISMNRSFDLKGSIYLGDRLDSQGGADGLAIFLHPNSVDTQITSGASVGMWNIPNAFGFKLDTFYNHGDDPLPDGDNVKLDGQGNAPFGAFTNTDATGNSEQLKNESTVQFIKDKSSILNKDATLLPFDFSYDASTKQFTVTFDNQTWTKKYDGDSENMVLVISAATGTSHNLQQVQLDSFSYSADPIYLSQQKAMDDLKNTANNTTTKINGDDKLTIDQKNDQNKNVADELQKALDSVQQQTTSDKVIDAENTGKENIEKQYVPGSQLNPGSSSASTQSSAASSSVESSAQSSSAESSAQSNSAESSAQSNSAESSAQSSSAESSAQSSSAESSAQSSSAESSAQSSSAESSAQSSSAESSAQSSSAESSAQSSSAESSAQ